MVRGDFEDPDLKRRIILKWIFKECNEVSWTGLIGVLVSFFCGFGRPGFIKCR